MDTERNCEYFKSTGVRLLATGLRFIVGILQLIALRAYNNGYHDFKLGTEVEDFGSFDDVVFSYPQKKDDPSSGRTYRLICVKHSTVSHKIAISDFFKNGYIDLKRYFISYLKITKDKGVISKRDQIKDLIVCTNTDFESGDEIAGFQLNDEIFETSADRENENDPLLGVKLVKFRKDFTGRRKLISYLQDGMRNEHSTNEIEAFLSILVFGILFPSSDKLNNHILEEICKACKNPPDLSHVSQKYFLAMQEWALDRVGRWLRETDVSEYLNLECMNFNLKEPVKNFIGRETVLRELHERLHGTSAGSKRKVLPQSQVIAGLGGIGKSEIARKYAKMHYGRTYKTVVWIDAENKETLERAFKMLAFDRLGLRRDKSDDEEKAMDAVVDEVYHSFQKGSTLFIFDNAEDTAVVKGFLPKSQENSFLYILVTSQRRDWKDMGLVVIDNFSPEEARLFFQESIGHIQGFNEAESDQLAQKLNYYPLAMQQAASYIAEMNTCLRYLGKNYGIGEYWLELFHYAPEDLLQYHLPGEMSNDYSRTTFQTMSLAIECLRSCNGGGVAMEFLSVMAYLYPDDIDVSFVCRMLHGHSDRELGYGLQLLQKFSIISMKEGMRVSIHRMVQLVCRTCFKEANEEVMILRKITKLCLGMGTEHASALLRYVSQHGNLMKEIDKKDTKLEDLKECVICGKK